MYSAIYINREEGKIYMDNSKRRNRGNAPQSMWLSGLLGGLVGIGIITAMILLLPFAVLRTENPNSLALPVAALSVFVGSAVGSFFGVKRCMDACYRVALIAAGVVCFPLLLFSFFIIGESSLLRGAIIFGTVLAGAMLTALAVQKFSANRKRNMKRVMKRR